MANNKKSETSLEDKVRNYSSEIKQISDFVAQVRQTPDMYVGKVLPNIAFNTMVREIFQNSIDEIMKGNAFSNNIWITFDELTKTVTVEDNGRGIPHGKIGIIFGTSHTSSNYNKKPYEYSAGKNGCGASMTNALSHIFIVDSYMLGKGKHAEFIEGHLWDKGEVDIPDDQCEGRQGTIITFTPNQEAIRGEITSTWKDIYDLISIIVPSTPKGTHVEYCGIDSNGVKHIENIDNVDGIMSYIINMTQTPYIEPIYVFADNGEMRCECAFTYDTTMDNGFECIISNSNTCPTDGGTHVDGAIDGITKWFRNYMNKIFLSKSKLNCTTNDIRQGLKLAVCTMHLRALFNGQAKELLSNKDMTPFVSSVIQTGLDEWSKTNSNDLQKLCKYFKEVIEIRMKGEKEKVKLSTKFTSSLLSGLPAKYVKPNSKNGEIELIIVEGDSAMGSARNSRDQATQGIFPIRGKLPNVFKKSTKKVLENEEISSILTIIGAGYGKNFDLSKCKVSKVIIMADADPDGAHIRTLVLRFLAMYCKPLVQAGRVYAALPPLYGIPEKKGYRFFTDKIDFIKFVQNEFSKSYEIKTINGKTLTKKEVTSLLYNNSDYITEIEKVANTYAIDPLLLEVVLVNINKSFNTFKKNIISKYRFMEVNQVNGITILKGIANEKYHEIFINDILLNDSQYIFNYLKASDIEYYLNDTKCTLYNVMSEFNKFMPPKLDRFKGLGEMDPEMLGPSTLHPNGDRLLVQYTFEDIDREIEEMRFINSNKNLLLADDDD